MSAQRRSALAAGQTHPDFKTIADFRKDNLKPLQAVARAAARQKAIHVAVPQAGALRLRSCWRLTGTRLAVNAGDQNFNVGSWRNSSRGRMHRGWRSICNNSIPAMPAEPGGTLLSQSELAAKIAALREKQDWHRELLGQLDAEQKQIGVTDARTRKLPTAQAISLATTRRWPWMPSINSSRRCD